MDKLQRFFIQLPNHCPHPSYSRRHFLLNIDDIRKLKQFSKILLRMHAKIASLSTYRPYTNTTVWANPFALSSNNYCLITVRSKCRIISQREQLGKKNHEWYCREWESKKNYHLLIQHWLSGSQGIIFISAASSTPRAQKNRFMSLRERGWSNALSAHSSWLFHHSWVPDFSLSFSRPSSFNLLQYSSLIR